MEVYWLQVKGKTAVFKEKCARLLCTRPRRKGCKGSLNRVSGGPSLGLKVRIGENQLYDSALARHRADLETPPNCKPKVLIRREPTLLLASPSTKPIPSSAMDKINRPSPICPIRTRIMPLFWAGKACLKILVSASTVNSATATATLPDTTRDGTSTSMRTFSAPMPSPIWRHNSSSNCRRSRVL